MKLCESLEFESIHRRRAEMSAHDATNKFKNCRNDPRSGRMMPFKPNPKLKPRILNSRLSDKNRDPGPSNLGPPPTSIPICHDSEVQIHSEVVKSSKYGENRKPLQEIGNVQEIEKGHKLPNVRNLSEKRVPWENPTHQSKGRRSGNPQAPQKSHCSPKPQSPPESQCSPANEGEPSWVRNCLQEQNEDSMLDKSWILFHRKESEWTFHLQDYRYDLYKKMVESQKKFMPKTNYMKKQRDITFSMRSVLVDWLVEVGEEYHLNNETLYLAVNYMDRFLSHMSVQKSKLQLLGVTCLFIAAKYEEDYFPTVSEFAYITDDTYSKKQVLRMEQLVLTVLNFELSVPTIYFFLNLFAKETGSNEKATFLAMYLSELSMLDAEANLHYENNIVAAAAVALARHFCNFAPWPKSAVELTALGVDDFRECLFSLHNTFTNVVNYPQQTITEKFKTTKYMGVAKIDPNSFVDVFQNG